jgi:ParB-like chromosome segregation protein Spo0J
MSESCAPAADGHLSIDVVGRTSRDDAGTTMLRSVARTPRRTRAGDPPCVIAEPAWVELRVDELRRGPFVRDGNLDAQHVARLTELDGAWPPLLVRRADHVIVDGHHRLATARRLGMLRVRCVYFDGTEEGAFVEAVRLNVDHGLPLSLAERKAAVRRLFGLFPSWSDRRIAAVCGVSHVTVGSLRATDAPPTGADSLMGKREGRDGRRRPIDSLARRGRIAAALQSDPDASLRTIARLTDSSHETVRSVRNEFAVEAAWSEPEAGDVPARVVPPTDHAIMSSAKGAAFAEWFTQNDITGSWRTYIADIPMSRIYQIEDEARRRASEWTAFATALAAQPLTRARHT